MKARLTVWYKNGHEDSRVMDIEEALSRASLAEVVKGFEHLLIEPEESCSGAR